jgi:hypothetical protein
MISGRPSHYFKIDPRDFFLNAGCDFQLFHQSISLIVFGFHGPNDIAQALYSL